jgi:hypothetical protein
MPIPTNADQLFVDLTEFSESTHRVLKEFPVLQNELPRPFEGLMWNWFVDCGGNPVVEERTGSMIAKLEAKGFDGSAFKARLENMRSSDPHLLSCTSPWILCRALGMFVDHLTNNINADGSYDRVFAKEYFESFIDGLYGQQFGVQILSHLYNFKMETDSADIANVQILRLQRNLIENVLGHPAMTILYYAPGVGEYYIRDEISNSDLSMDNCWDAISEAMKRCDALVGILQYLKDGIVDRDYSIVRFRPIWLNQFVITAPLGESQKIPFAEGAAFYTLEESDIPIAERWLGLYQARVQTELENDRSDLGNSLKVAIEFFDSSFEAGTPEERLINLMVALEAMFSPDDNQELSYKIKQYAAQLLGQTSAERVVIFKNLTKIYKLRSGIVHGSLDIDKYQTNTLVPTEQLIQLVSIVRRSILRLIVLFLNGNRLLHKKNGEASIHHKLDMAALDVEVAESLRNDSNPESFLTSVILNKG